MTKEVKTYENWKGNLNEYLKIGDIVDEGIYHYFLEILPPACWNHSIIQMGEAYGLVHGKQTYLTLKLVEDNWIYCGACHLGKIVEPS